MKTRSGGDREMSKLGSHLHGNSATDLAVEEFAERNGLAGHFFKAKSLGTELDTVTIIFLGAPSLVFDGKERFATLLLDDIGDPAKAKLMTAEWDGPQGAGPGPGGHITAVCLLVKDISFGGEAVLRPLPLNMDERALAFTVEQVLEGGDRQEVRLFVGHGI